MAYSLRKSFIGTIRWGRLRVLVRCALTPIDCTPEDCPIDPYVPTHPQSASVVVRWASHMNVRMPLCVNSLAFQNNSTDHSIATGAAANSRLELRRVLVCARRRGANSPATGLKPATVRCLPPAPTVVRRAVSPGGGGSSAVSNRGGRCIAITNSRAGGRVLVRPWQRGGDVHGAGVFVGRFLEEPSWP